MTVSFTQTYGDRRSELHDIHLRDTRLLEFKKFFDVNIYSFHNVPYEIKKSFMDRLPLKNVISLVQGTTHYSDTIATLKLGLKSLDATHIFFSQDDTFSADNKDIDWKEFFNYVTWHKRNFFLSLAHSPDDFVNEWKPDLEFETFGIYERTVQDWKDHDLWAMDDQPFVCTIDTFNELYNEERLAKMDVWSMEIFLRKVWEKRENAPKFITDRNLFYNYNMHGMNTADKIYYRELLEEKNLL